MADAVLGTTISGKYRLRAVLGRGAMGEVYRAEQLDIEGHVLREVALKMVRPEYSDEPAFARRFLNEVRVATQLLNLHSVTVYDSGRAADGQLYFVMELIDGVTLQTLLTQEKTLSVARALEISGQICAALAEAHGLPAPIIHRDLKPANIFVEQREGKDWVKVGDFGIAKILGSQTSGLTQTGMSPGTPRYMAPEQWKGQAVDGRADIYTLGIMLYEMLAGTTPFSTDGGPMALMYQHLNDPPPPLPQTIPVGVQRLVGHLLAKEPDERPADVLSVRRGFEAALTELPARRSSEHPPPRRQSPPATGAEDGGAFHEERPSPGGQHVIISKRVAPGAKEGKGWGLTQRSVLSVSIGIATLLFLGASLFWYWGKGDAPSGTGPERVRHRVKEFGIPGASPSRITPVIEEAKTPKPQAIHKEKGRHRPVLRRAPERRAAGEEIPPPPGWGIRK